VNGLLQDVLTGRNNRPHVDLRPRRAEHRGRCARALDLQERAVEQLRSRTGTLLAASSLVASFLGAQTIQHTSGLGVLGGLALVSLAVSIGLCVYVLLPKKGFRFSLSAPEMYEQLFDVRDNDEEVRRRLVYWLEEFWQVNQVKIDELGRYYLGAAVALGLQLVFGRGRWRLTFRDHGRPTEAHAAASSRPAAARSRPSRDLRRVGDPDEVGRVGQFGGREATLRLSTTRRLNRFRPCPFRRPSLAGGRPSRRHPAPPQARLPRKVEPTGHRSRASADASPISAMHQSPRGFQRGLLPGLPSAAVGVGCPFPS
jgi:hypothetical protein